MLIESTANPKIKQYVKLRDSKKARRELSMAVIEGARFCSDALAQEKRGKLKIICVFATEQALDRYSDYIDRTLFDNVSSGKYFMISQAVADKISDTGNTQGVFAVAQTWDVPFTVEALSGGGRYVVLDNLQDPGNIGTILRTADALGLDGAVLANRCCELYNPKLLRSTMGSIFRIPIYMADDLKTAAEIMHGAGIKLYAAVVDENAVPLGSFMFKEGSAVVIGNEGSGLSVSDADICDERITIHMRGNAESLNAASAAAIILWEMSKHEYDVYRKIQR